MDLNNYMVLALAEAIHRTMCYRGAETPICNADKGDAYHMAEQLRQRGWRLTREDDGGDF